MPIATVTGTERDPQCRSQQIATLEDAGIAVVSSLPEATLLAAALIHPLSPATQQHTPSLLENVAVINTGYAALALGATKRPANRLCITNGRQSPAAIKNWLVY